MDFSELLSKRRSIRNYQERDVPVEIIQDIIRDSILAPSSSNEQTWKFIIVNRRSVIKRISDESKKNILSRIEKNPDDYAKRYEAALRNGSFNVFYNAPCLVIILGPRDYRNLHVNCALAASYFMMSAVSRGLGTCWVNLGAFIEDRKLRGELGIPDDCSIVAPIIIGYPADIPSPPSRREPEILKIIT